MKDALMKRLKISLLREDKSTLIGIPASQEKIANAQLLLNVNFHEDLCGFYPDVWGCAYVGLVVYGNLDFEFHY